MRRRTREIEVHRVELDFGSRDSNKRRSTAASAAVGVYSVPAGDDFETALANQIRERTGYDVLVARYSELD